MKPFNGRQIYSTVVEKPWELKPYQEIECPMLEDIRREVLAWMARATPYLTDREDPRLDRPIDDQKDFIRSCPSLVKYMSLIKVPMRRFHFLIIPPHRTNPLELHVGEHPENIKVNVPILNTTTDAVTEWFGIPQEDLEKYPMLRRYHFEDGVEMLDLREIHHTVQDLYPMVGQYCMTNSAVVFNGNIPHRVMMPSADHNWPRIILTMVPIKEEQLVPYLQK